MKLSGMWLCVLVAACVLAGCAGGRGSVERRVEAGVHFRQVRLGDGTEHRFAVYVPWAVVGQAGSRAAAVFLNGSGECGTDGTKQLAVGMLPAMMIDPAGWPLVGVFPQKPTRESAWEEHREMVMACVEAAVLEFGLDRDRIALTGLSQGGHGTWMLGAMEPKVWSCVAPICGPMSAEDRAAVVGGIPESMPVWSFHGLADPVVEAADTTGMDAALRARGMTTRLTLYEGVGHNSWDRAYREEGLGVWMAGQRRAHRGG